MPVPAPTMHENDWSQRNTLGYQRHSLATWRLERFFHRTVRVRASYKGCTHKGRWRLKREHRRKRARVRCMSWRSHGEIKTSHLESSGEELHSR